MKRCYSCKVEKFDSLFNESQKSNDGLQSYCKECQVSKAMTWLKNNPHKARKARMEHLWRKQGFVLTIERYDEMLAEQAGRCAICKEAPGKKSLAADHDHDTGQVRRLLCLRCNRGLGFFRDRPDLTEAATRYLVQFGRVKP